MISSGLRSCFIIPFTRSLTYKDLRAVINIDKNRLLLFLGGLSITPLLLALLYYVVPEITQDIAVIAVLVYLGYFMLLLVFLISLVLLIIALVEKTMPTLRYLFLGISISTAVLGVLISVKLIPF